MIRTAVGILVRDAKVLVAERPVDKPYAGYWEFPGGKIEANESDSDALKRELHEELGIDVLSLTPLCEHTHTYPDKVVLLSVWLITDYVGEPEGKERQQLRWVTIPEMLELRILEGNRQIIDHLQRSF